MSDGLLSFGCPLCRERLVTLSEHAERLIDCPRCSARLVVPDPTSPMAAGDTVRWAEEAVVDLHPSSARVETEMDMTPMVDMTFLLLIFFMVTARFAMQKSFELPTPDPQLPSSNYQVMADEDRVTVRIDEFNTYHVSSSYLQEEQEAPTEQELLRRMREARMASDGSGQVAHTLVVEAHTEAYHASVVTALDAGNEMGFEDIKVRTLPDEEGS